MNTQDLVRGCYVAFGAAAAVAQCGLSLAVHCYVIVVIVGTPWILFACDLLGGRQDAD